ncbi:MAG: copper chaperone PCu(A)C [Alphaproteobacteria bacterium]|nr:copper chaperone PCu(A)C [Alphaproteobacteria bacterium]
MMKILTTIRHGVVAASLALVALFAFNAPVLAHSMGPIHIESSFARASASPAAKSGAAYVTIMNKGDTADRLIGVEGDAASMIQIHKTEMANGVMTMKEVEGGLEIPAGGMIALEPGGNHLMMMGLKAPLVEGQTLPLTLVFEKAGKIDVEIPVLAPGAMMGEMDHSKMKQ